MNDSLQYTSRELTEKFEGLRLSAYLDANKVPTIGYGHTSGVSLGMTCTQEQADTWLSQDIEWAATCVKNLVKVPLTQNQFDALVDFVYNIGSGNFEKSTLLKVLNQGQYVWAESLFHTWVYAGGVTQSGLVARREAEANMFHSAP
jgi:lysozyme